ncbi:MAG TPA: T9SS type A sorting domain-containing protein, partial [Draconibacterium sp.]|nr:T9SS type A sorting domain-containing protein [Draconibacterium sp.]
MKTIALKSSRIKVVEMPPFSNFSITEKEDETNESAIKLKPFRFAHPFEVNLTPENSGEWLQGENGYLVWKLTIRSAGAKSINLIFDEFYLPANTRVFLYNEKENHVLGAFTNINNQSSGKFAVSPVLGDEITVQYEIPEAYFQQKHFRITRVNHDYVGILKAGGRRPMDKPAGTCNIDINCDEWEDWSEVKNSVCRLIVNGTDVCSGVLVNNTAENQKPYILSAAHCYNRWNYAETTVYTFNYESPFCAPLDGDPSNSISGATMKAQHDSLDFALVELSMLPPPDFRPYFAGWTRSSEFTNSSASITHPQGDIKKISYDADAPSISNFNGSYTKNAFLKIGSWEKGVTEDGSSGGPLFDKNKNILGTLTGGDSDCTNPLASDYYNRFAISWDFRSDTAKQLKYWLDPIKSGVQVLNGKQFYEDENLCGAFTNLSDADDYSMIPMLSSGKFAGYWGGSNSLGITEITERFSINGNESLSGVSMGVGKFKNKTGSSNSEIKIKVYNGTSMPERLIYSQVVKTSSLAPDAMNFIGFNEEVKPDEVFFIGFELSNIQPLDSFAVYQSLRTANDINTFYFLQNNKWYNFKDSNTEKKAMANIFEIVACNIDNFTTDTPLVDNPLELLVFPNPSNSKVTVEAGQDISVNQIAVFNLLGQKTEVSIRQLGPRKLDLDLTGNVPGVYFVRLDTGKDVVSRKVSFVPW